MKKIRNCINLLALLFLTLVAITAYSQSSTDVISYTRMYADASGETHFEDRKISFGEPGPGGARTTPFTSATQVGHVLLPTNFESGWRSAPRRQWLFILSGTLEMEVSDGEVRQFPGGSIAFVEDTTGKGHKAHNIGKESVILAWVPVDPD